MVLDYLLLIMFIVMCNNILLYNLQASAVHQMTRVELWVIFCYIMLMVLH